MSDVCTLRRLRLSYCIGSMSEAIADPQLTIAPPSHVVVGSSGSGLSHNRFTQASSLSLSSSAPSSAATTSEGIPPLSTTTVMSSSPPSLSSLSAQNIISTTGKSRHVARHTHRWSCYVRPVSSSPEEEVFFYSLVQSVTFKLDRSFNEPVRVVDTPPFACSDVAWSEHHVEIIVTFVDECGLKPFEVRHTVLLRNRAPPIQCPVGISAANIATAGVEPPPSPIVRNLDVCPLALKLQKRELEAAAINGGGGGVGFSIERMKPEEHKIKLEESSRDDDNDNIATLLRRAEHSSSPSSLSAELRAAITSALGSQLLENIAISERFDGFVITHPKQRTLEFILELQRATLRLGKEEDYRRTFQEEEEHRNDNNARGRGVAATGAASQRERARKQRDVINNRLHRHEGEEGEGETDNVAELGISRLTRLIRREHAAEQRCLALLRDASDVSTSIAAEPQVKLEEGTTGASTATTAGGVRSQRTTNSERKLRASRVVAPSVAGATNDDLDVASAASGVVVVAGGGGGIDELFDFGDDVVDKKSLNHAVFLLRIRHQLTHFEDVKKKRSDEAHEALYKTLTELEDERIAMLNEINDVSKQNARLETKCKELLLRLERRVKRMREDDDEKTRRTTNGEEKIAADA